MSRPTERSLRELAERIGARVEGDGAVRVTDLHSLEAAGPEHIAPLLDRRFRARLQDCRAGALLLDEGLAKEISESDERPRLVADKARLAMVRLLETFHPTPRPAPGIHPTAVLGDGCEIDPAATVGPYVVVGEGSRLAAGVWLEAHSVVGRHCDLGEGCRLHPQAVLYDETVLEAGCEIHSGAVIGADGFGYATDGGTHHKVPQVGRVVLEAGVEVGANAAIDRATLGETRIGVGSKVDNLVQIGHNCQTGRACILSGQVGLAGSTTLGDGVVLAGQSGASGHIRLGDGVQVAAKSAVLNSIPDGQKVAGIPAVELSLWKRRVVLFGKLQKLVQRLRGVEDRLAAVEEAAPVKDEEGRD
ncbi:MAG: UDP-3-O-(3-hydroxymyristoyl)glucosamine N-acyltransferase [Acidobacteriota bacterium]